MIKQKQISYIVQVQVSSSPALSLTLEKLVIVWIFT